MGGPSQRGKQLLKARVVAPVSDDSRSDSATEKQEKPIIKWDFLYLQCDVPFSKFSLAKDGKIWFYELLGEGKEVVQVERVSNNCLLRAIKYQDTIKIYAHKHKMDKQFKALGGEERLLDETREMLVAMGKAVKEDCLMGKVHGRLQEVDSYGFRKVLPGNKRTYDESMEVFLLNGKKQPVGISEEELLELQLKDIKDLGVAYKKFLNMEDKKQDDYPPYLKSWLKLVDEMGNVDDMKKNKNIIGETFMWMVITHPTLWNFVQRRGIFEYLWLKRKDNSKIMDAISKIENHNGWKANVPEGPLRRMLDRKFYEDTSAGLFRFIRCVFKHICDREDGDEDVEVDVIIVHGKGPNKDISQKGYKYLKRGSDLMFFKPKYVEMVITQQFPEFLPALYVALLDAQTLP